MGCKFTMRCSVLLLFLLTVVKAEDKAFVMANLTMLFKCEVLPKSDFCPSDINVQDGTIAAFENMTKSINQTLGIYNVSCIDAIRKTTCLGIPRCEPERVYVDVDAVIAECEKGRNVCPQLIVPFMFNCTAKKEQFQMYPINAFALKCKNIQDGSGFCPEVKYKRVEYPGANFSQLFNVLKMNIEMIKPNVTEECYEQVKETACIFSTTACSDNEKYGLALLSMQECKKRFKCLPQPLYANISKGCNGLPDETTAKEVPLPSGAAGKPTVKPTGSYIQPMATSSVNQTGGKPTGTNKPSTGPTDGSSIIRAVYNMVAFSLISLLFL